MPERPDSAADVEDAPELPKDASHDDYLIHRLACNAAFVDTFRKKYSQVVEAKPLARYVAPGFEFGFSIISGGAFDYLAKSIFSDYIKLMAQVLAKSFAGAVPFSFADLFISWLKRRYTKEQIDEITMQAIDEVIDKISADEDLGKTLSEVKEKLGDSFEFSDEQREILLKKLQLTRQELLRNFFYFIFVMGGLFTILNTFIDGYVNFLPNSVKKYAIDLAARMGVAILVPPLGKYAFGLNLNVPMEIATMMCGFSVLALGPAFLPKIHPIVDVLIQGTLSAGVSLVPRIAVSAYNSIYSWWNKPRKKTEDQEEREPILHAEHRRENRPDEP